jgi:DNA-binding winged helix-turn-helix (wHTH) protein
MALAQCDFLSGPDFYLGRWLVQPELGYLIGGSRTLRLEPKVMEVLVCLSKRAPRLVLKRDLMAQIWRDAFVTDDVLKRSIHELRKAFDETAQCSSIIETIPRRGYRLTLLPTSIPKKDIEVCDVVAVSSFGDQPPFPVRLPFFLQTALTLWPGERS